MTFEDRRDNIVAAACAVIGERGLDRFRVQDVASAAGVSQPLVSRHFASRDEIVTAAFLYADQQANHVLKLRESTDDSGRERLLIWLLGTLKDDDPNLASSNRMWYEVWNNYYLPAELSELIRQRQQAWVAAIESHIRRAQEDGSLPSEIDPAESALFVVAITDGVQPARHHGLISAEQAERLIRTAVASLVGA